MLRALPSSISSMLRRVVVEFLEECGSNEDDDAGILSVLVAPESFKAFNGGPSGVVSFRGVCFLKADDVRLRCQSK